MVKGIDLPFIFNKIIILVALFFVFSCSKKSASQGQSSAPDQRRIQQGVTGQVLWFEGDLMPKIVPEDQPQPPRSKGKPVSRTIYVYELTNRNQVSRKEHFFVDISTQLVKKDSTDKKGQFAIGLEPGKYSLMVKEKKGLYANRYDGQGNINPVTIQKDSITHLDIRIDYKAVY